MTNAVRSSPFPTQAAVADRFNALFAPLDLRPFPGLADQARKLMTAEGMRAKYHALRGHLVNVPDLAGSRGLDVGCGYGLPICLMRLMGAGRLLGCDVLAERIAGARHWLAQLGMPDIDFTANPPDGLPLGDASVDWVTAIGLYANLNLAATRRLFEDVRRVLRPGGLFLLNESTNPHFPPVRQAIADRFREEEQPGGSLFEERRAHIRDRAPGLGEDALATLTRSTCYLWGAALDDAVIAFLSHGTMPASQLDVADLSRVPLRARSGNLVMRPCDPWDLRGELAACGFSVRFRTPAADRFLEEGDMEAYFSRSRGVFVVARAGA
ncbi:MAG: class I SAM-dependent methyltransferase [Rhodospirillaceae bacterium]|nr:class I SAM-dependent methyltransferase [Rhodospirillaceae bacterium]